MTENFYCSGCLRTQAFVAADQGWRCPICRKVLIITEGRPPGARLSMQVTRPEDLDRPLPAAAG